MANTTTEYVLNYYGYDPSEAGAITSAILFAILGLVVLVLNIRFKSWFLMAVPIAAFMETIGFALRLHSAYDMGPYIVSVLCVLLAPTVFAIADYGLISRVMIRTGIHHPIFKPSMARWVFLFADVASFFVQCTGGGLTAMDDVEVSKNGARMLLAGLSLALSVFCFFLFLLGYVHKVLVSKDGYSTQEGKNVKAILFVMFVDMILFVIRSAYRVAEYGDLKFHNSISTNEGLFYGLDGAEMLVLNALWIPFHPGFWNMVDDHPNSKEQAKEEVAMTAASTASTASTSSPDAADVVIATEETELTPQTADFQTKKETKICVED